MKIGENRDENGTTMWYERMGGLRIFLEMFAKSAKTLELNLLTVWDWRRAKRCTMIDLVKSFPTSIWLQKIGFDTAENEPLKVWTTDISDCTFDHIPSNCRSPDTQDFRV